MKNKKYIILILCVLFIAHVKGRQNLKWDMNSFYSLDKVIYVGNIQFPQSLQKTPQMAMYRGGKKIKTETDDINKKIQFIISENKNYKTFYILITQNIQPHMRDNTVQFLKIDPQQKYKFYKLDIKTKKANKDSYEWNIKKEHVPEEGRLPDNTLIIIYNPEYVDTLEGGSDLELPKIVMKQNILNPEEEALLLLTSLKLNSIHSLEESEIKQYHNKKLIVAMAKP